MPPTQDTGVDDLLARFETALESGDRDTITAVCVTDPSLLIFDRDGHNYRSREHWSRRPALTASLRGARRSVTLDGDAGWVTYDSSETQRTSLVLVRVGDAWRIAHVHSSAATPGPRPGGI